MLNVYYHLNHYTTKGFVAEWAGTFWKRCIETSHPSPKLLCCGALCY